MNATTLAKTPPSYEDKESVIFLFDQIVANPNCRSSRHVPSLKDETSPSNLPSEKKQQREMAWKILNRIDSISIGLIRQGIKGVSQSCDDSCNSYQDPFTAFKTYLSLKGLEDYADSLKEYHLMPFKNGIMDSPALRAEILTKKARILLKEKFGGNILQFVTQVHRSELASPFVEMVVDVPVIVKTSTAMEKEGKLIDAMRTILRELGYEELADIIQEYHLARPHGIYTNDDTLKHSILKRKFDSMLPNYNNDVVRMLCEFHQDEFIKPLSESLTDPKSKASIHIDIETSTINIIYGGDRWKMIQDYLTIKELDDIKRDLRKYHLKQTPAGVYESDEGKEFLKRHLDSIRKSPPYNGNINKFIKRVTLPELEKPFDDVVGGALLENGSRSGGTKITVSTLSLTRFCNSSPTEMIEVYLKTQRRKVHSQRFETTNRTKVKQGSNQDLDFIRNVLFRKLDHLMETRFQGDFIALRNQLSRTSISTPFMAKINKRDSARVVTATAWRTWERMGGDIESLLSEYENFS